MYFLESISSQKIGEIKFLKIISIIDSIDGGVGSINARIFFFKTLPRYFLKDGDLCNNSNFYFAECLLSIMYYV